MKAKTTVEKFAEQNETKKCDCCKTGKVKRAK
jgi:hypothetical protein